VIRKLIVKYNHMLVKNGSAWTGYNISFGIGTKGQSGPDRNSFSTVQNNQWATHGTAAPASVDTHFHRHFSLNAVAGYYGLNEWQGDTRSPHA
jgi:hypothetical protein